MAPLVSALASPIFKRVVRASMISTFVLIMLLIFGTAQWIWYPGGLLDVMGMRKFLWTSALAWATSGPALCLLLIRGKKTYRAIWVDVALIAFIQLFVLAYVLNVCAHNRPLVVVHEVDRYRAVSRNDIPDLDWNQRPSYMRLWALDGPRLVGLKASKSLEEKLARVGSYLGGVEASQRPQNWLLSGPDPEKLQAASRSIEQLVALHPESKAEITHAFAEATALAGSDVRWMPMITQRTMDWSVLIDQRTGATLAYIHVEGFAPDK